MKRTNPSDRLAQLRLQIDLADQALLKALEKRMKTVLRIAQHKQKHGLPLVQKGRWAALMKERMRLSKKAGLDKTFTKDLFNLIHREALRLQKNSKKRKAK